MWILERWFGQSAAASLLVAAGVLTVALTIATPSPIRKRLRAAIALFVLYFALEVCAYALEQPSRAFVVLDGAASVVASIALARTMFVVLVDIAWERAGRAPMNQLVRDVLQAALFSFAIFGALHALGVRPVSLLATGTVLTAIVGLALQETLGNLAAGAAIQLERPIEPGDWVRMEAGDVIGRVVSTNWRSVTIEGDDRLHVVVPNSQFSRNSFINYSRPGGAFRRNVYFVVPFDVPPSRVHEAALAACGDTVGVLAEPAPSIVTAAFVDSGVQYWLRYFINDFASRDRCGGELLTRVWYHLNRRKIEIAIPIRKQFVVPMDASARAAIDESVIRDRRAAIDAIDVLQPLPESARDELARRGRRLLFAAGETILRAGAPGRELYVVRRGEVIVRRDGRELDRLGPSEVFGELALLTGNPRHADVVAAVETEVFEIGEAAFRDTLGNEPVVAERISALVTARSRALAPQTQPVATSANNGAEHGVLARVRELFGLT